MSETIVPVIDLLRSAGVALRRDAEQARRFIEQAAALLQATARRELSDAEPVPATARGGLAPWQVARVTAYVDAHLGEKITLEDLAAQARLSTSYFSRAFHATVGTPPRAWVIRRRIERAQAMMRETGKPLSEIALDCGLADQAHLSRHFRRIAGTSPAAWRRQHSVGPEMAAA